MQLDFDKAYSQLNDEQRLAVESIEGPVMLIAGPGSGKTQVLGMRILKILQQTDTKPNEILCLTYTEAAAGEMRNRLIKFMGAAANQIHIYTYHGLCNNIIQNNADLFGLKQMQLMDELDKQEIMDKLFLKLPPNSIIKKFSEERNDFALMQFFDLMQKENWSSAYFQALIQELSKEETYKLLFPEDLYKKDKTKFKANTYDTFLSNCEKLKAYAVLFDDYVLEKNKRSMYDFSDMIQFVLNAFEKYPWLLQSNQEKFQYVLADEYQDTNGIQNELLFALISHWEQNPNCFVVGDEDQSIYMFQGAHPENMMHFENKFTQFVKKISLKKNYRSSQQIVNATQQFISGNILRNEKHLEAAGKYKDETNEIGVEKYENPLVEAAEIIKKIKQLILDGINPNEIAVIYRNHKNADFIIDACLALNVPFQLKTTENILEFPLINNMLNWISYYSLEIDLPHSGEHLLIPMLYAPMHEIPPLEIANLIYNKNTNDQYGNMHWREYIREISEKNDNKLHEKMKTLHAQIEENLKLIQHLSIPEIIQKLYQNQGVVKWCLTQDNSREILQSLHTLLAFINNKCMAKNIQSLKEINVILQKYKTSKLQIPLAKYIGNENGINLVTAHSSKGLEFEYVYIIQANRNIWETDKGRNLGGLNKLLLGNLRLNNINKTDGGEAEEEHNQLQELEEIRRLFYVACTRAKKELNISYVNHNFGKISFEPCSFLVNLPIHLPEKSSNVSAENLDFVLMQSLVQTNKPSVEIAESAWLDDQISKYIFSPSTINTILNCGLKFYYLHIVKIPSAPSQYFGYGNAMHETLKIWLNKISKNESVNKELIISIFEKEMLKQRIHFSAEMYAQRLLYGKEMLDKLFDKNNQYFVNQKHTILEKNIQGNIEHVRITGKIDKIVLEDTLVCIVDYKTGSNKNIEKHFKSISEKMINENKLPADYTMQLGIYQLLFLQNDVYTQKHAHKRVTTSIESLTKDESDFPIMNMVFTDEQLQFIKNWVLEADRRLKSKEFLTGCGKSDCEWCGFAKQFDSVVYQEQSGD